MVLRGLGWSAYVPHSTIRFYEVKKPFDVKTFSGSTSRLMGPTDGSGGCNTQRTY